MNIRLFRCGECGHKMRVRGDACGYCHARKDVHQRPGLYLMFFVLPAAALISVASLFL